MTFLAVLKDSWREALDAKVLYFMLGLALLVIIAVGGTTFYPRPADAGLEAILDRLPGVRLEMGFLRAPGPLRYQLENFQQLNNAPPWDGEYQFDVTVQEVPMMGPDGKEEPTEGAFPLVVFMFAVQQKETENLSAEDQEARKRLQSMGQAAQALPPEQVKKFLSEKMLEEVRRVSPTQMERFLQQQLATQGTLETTRVHLESKKSREYHFAVEAHGRPDTYRTWPHTVSYLFGAIRPPGEGSIGEEMYFVERWLIGTVGAGITLLISTIVTAFFIPNMLQKGTIDMLLAKPIRRSTLLIYKYIGGLIFMFLNTAFVIVGIWLVLGSRSGLWWPGFLVSIFIFTFEFAIFYAVSLLFGMLTRSAVISILMTCLAWLVLFLFGLFYQYLVEPARKLQAWPAWAYMASDTVHFVLPRYMDLDALNQQMIARGLLASDSPRRKKIDEEMASTKWGETVGSTAACIAVLLGISCWWFSTRDY